jgi:hypothetical protein
MGANGPNGENRKNKSEDFLMTRTLTRLPFEISAEKEKTSESTDIIGKLRLSDG